MIANNFCDSNNGLRKSSHISNPRKHLCDYHVYLSQANTFPIIEAKYPLHLVLSYHKLSPTFTRYCLNIFAKVEPKT